jgi:membrane-bound metal-dependent hydrolase YbcI (DUF457 family)
MDPVSHGLFGRLIAGFDDRGRLGPGSRAAFVLGALAPDLDILLVTRGWDVYLHWHEIGTHALAASPFLALGVAALVRLFSKQARFGPLVLSAWIGVVVGHLGFDLLSGGDMRLFWPFWPRRFGPHLLAMADLVAVAILAATTVLSVWRRRAAAVAAVTLLAILITVKAVTQTKAAAAFAGAVSHDAGEVAPARPEAINGSLTSWDFYDREGNVLRAWRVDARTGTVRLLFERDEDVTSNLKALASSVPAVATFLPLAQLPFVRLESDRGKRYIWWSDLRYCDATFCGLSFGAELDAEDRPIRQVIRIGTFEQTRPIKSTKGGKE